jgi:replicative superfamily II helicase
MTCAAHLVVVMGTQYYDGTGLGASDYPVTDLIQILGRASRPGVDEVGEGFRKQTLIRLSFYVPLVHRSGELDVTTSKACHS